MEAINLDCIGIFYSLSPINTLAKAMSCLFLNNLFTCLKEIEK